MDSSPLLQRTQFLEEPFTKASVCGKGSVLTRDFEDLVANGALVRVGKKGRSDVYLHRDHMAAWKKANSLAQTLASKAHPFTVAGVCSKDGEKKLEFTDLVKSGVLVKVVENKQSPKYLHRDAVDVWRGKARDIALAKLEKNLEGALRLITFAQAKKGLGKPWEAEVEELLGSPRFHGRVVVLPAGKQRYVLSVAAMRRRLDDLGAANAQEHVTTPPPASSTPQPSPDRDAEAAYAAWQSAPAQGDGQVTILAIQQVLGWPLARVHAALARLCEEKRVNPVRGEPTVLPQEARDAALLLYGRSYCYVGNP